MVAWILVVNFLLHGIALLFIVLLYTRFVRLKEWEQTQSAMMKEMEEVFSAHLMEMKEQNDEFIQRFEQMKRDKESASKKESSPSNIPVFDKLSVPSKQDFLEMMDTEKADNASVPDPPQSPKEPAVMLEWDGKEDLEPEQIKKMALSLQKKGLTIEEIAKHLHRGKTEIELLLVFNKKL